MANPNGVALRELVEYLDAYLDVARVPDFPGAANGLQVENTGRVRRLAASTDACEATIEAAAAAGADLLLVHHGLFWGEGLRPLTDRAYRRVRALLRHDIAVYAAHLPLDVHPEVGNNVQLVRRIGCEVSGRFGTFEGVEVGVYVDADWSAEELVERVGRAVGARPRVLGAGPARCRRVGIVTGAGASLMGAARAAGCDTFVTGEAPHHAALEAEEWGMRLVLAGHYATETLGVRALAEHLEARFGLPWTFLDHPTGL